MKVAIHIRVKPEIANAPPEGETKKRELHAKGFDNVLNVAVAKYIVLELKDGTTREEIEAMCEKLLANRVTENYTITDL